MTNPTQHLDTVTRVEVIDENGRAWTTYNASNVLISMQDNDRTLKIFLKSNKPEPEEKKCYAFRDEHACWYENPTSDKLRYCPNCWGKVLYN